MPKVSVVMGTFNENESDLRASIESVLNQSFTDFEFIILLDNPKNELHKKILDEYSKKDKRVIYYINEKNLGLAMNLNKGISLSSGEYIARTDADDLCMVDRFKKQVEFLDNNKDICVLATNKIIIDENNNELYKAKPLPTNYKKISKLLEYQSFLSHSSIMFRKKEIESIGCYRNLPTTQDYDLWLRCTENNLNISILDEYLVKNKIRSDSISNKNLLRQWCIHEYILLMHKQWKKTKINDYSIDKLNIYLEKNNVYNEKNIIKYNNGRNYFTNFKAYLSKRKFFEAFIALFKSLFSHKKILKLYLNGILYNLNK